MGLSESLTFSIAVYYVLCVSLEPILNVSFECWICARDSKARINPLSLSLSSEYKPSSSRTFCGERVALKLLSLRFTHLVCVASRYFHSLGRVGVSRWGWVLQIKFPCHSKQRLSREGYRATDQRRAFLPATVSTSGRIHGEMLRVLYLLATKRLPRSSGTSASRMMSAPRHIAGVGGGLEFCISAYCSV